MMHATTRIALVAVLISLTGSADSQPPQADPADPNTVEDFESGGAGVFSAGGGTSFLIVSNNGVVPAIGGGQSGSATSDGISDVVILFTFFLEPGVYNVSVDVQAIADVQPTVAAEASFDPNGVLVSHAFEPAEFVQVAADEWASPVFTLTAPSVDASGGVISGTLNFGAGFRWLFDNLRAEPAAATPEQIIASIRQTIDAQAAAGGINGPYANDLHHRLDKIASAIHEGDRRMLDREMDKLLADLDKHIGDPNKLTSDAANEITPPLTLLWRTAHVPVFTDDSLRVAGVRVGDDLPWSRGKANPESAYHLNNQVAGASAGSLGPVTDHVWWVCTDANDALEVMKEDEKGTYNHVPACHMDPTAEQAGFDTTAPHYIGRVMALMHLKIEGFHSGEGFGGRTTELLVYEEIAPEIGDQATGIGNITDIGGALRSDGLGFAWHLRNDLNNHSADFQQGGTFSGGSELPNTVLARTTTEWYQKDDSGLLIPGTKREVTTGFASRKIE